jgi:hypothetical protein
MSSMLTCYLIKDILMFISLTGKNISFRLIDKGYMVLSILNVIMFGCVICLWNKLATDYDPERGSHRHEKENYYLMLETEHEDFHFKIVLAFFILVEALHIFKELMYTELFGVLVQIIYKIVYDALNFILIYAFMHCIFTVIGVILFDELPEFKDFLDSTKTLFEAGLGRFDYDMFVDDMAVHPTIGKLYLTLYLFISMIILLNFLIAILSHAYSKNTSKGKSMFLSLVMRKIISYEPHPIYSCLDKPLIFTNFLYLSYCYQLY